MKCFMKILKLIFIISLLIILVYSCKSRSDSKFNKNEVSAGWSEEDKHAFLEGCIDSKPIKGFTPKETEEYCKCVLEKTIEEYPTNELDGDLPEDFVFEAGIECLELIRQ